MGKINPLFLTAPRLKLVIGGETIAYAIGFNVAVSVDVQPVFVVGSYGPVSLEPTLYNTVTGTLQIVRLLSSPSRTANVIDTKGVDKLGNFEAAGGKSLSSAVPLLNDKYSNSKSTDGTSTNNLMEQSKLFAQITPKLLLVSQTFDIDVYLSVPNTQAVSFVAATNTTKAKEEVPSGINVVALMKIYNCRITSRNTNISMGQLVNSPLSFQGLLLSPAITGQEFALDGVGQG